MIFVELIAIFTINVVHAVLGFLIKVNYFNINDLLGASPLFDFSISDDCQDKTAVVFHKWGGRLDYEWTVDENLNPTQKIVVVDETGLKKINGYYFCYKNISYLDLLYNGQIIKEGEECPSEYRKSCGRLDTLKQKLCIKETEKCPLYDVGLGSASDSENYDFVSGANVYYNNENYNKPNQKIIRRLVLNDGQPCYNTSEKLWRSYSSKEGFKTNLQCDMEIFGKYNDDRYEERGEISYKRLYQDNLNSECQNIVVPYLSGNEKAYLYKREFFGIEKECNSKYNLKEDSYKYLHNSEESEYYLLLIEGILVAALSLPFLLIQIISCSSDDDIIPGWLYCIFYSIFMAMLFCCFVCQSVFYSRVANNDLTGYNCSDDITNEIIKNGFEDSSRNILYITINFYLELCLFAGNWIAILVGYLMNNTEACLHDNSSNLDSQPKSYRTRNERNYDKTGINENPETKASEIPLNTYYPNPS